MDRILLEFIAQIAADADLLKSRPEIVSKAEQLLVDDIVIKSTGINITDSRFTANC